MILVDTDVLIAHRRGHEAARPWLRHARAQQRLAVSADAITELTGGMRSAERGAVERLLGIFDTKPVTVLIAREAGALMRRYRRSHTGIGLATISSPAPRRCSISSSQR